ncbi:MAG: adenylate kinase [Blastocatellia bacterium AA13]|nr:MAG: adenylate kinase [Blastocatellia bacterium AA13]
MARIIVLMGPQGAGKGTQGQMLAERLNVPAVATGDMLREIGRSDTPLGRQVKQIQDAGQLVSDEVLAEMIKERLSRIDCARGCILDGFPRTLPQAKLLDEITKQGNLDLFVVNIQVPRDQLWKRLTGRAMCSHCGTIYNSYFKPSKQTNVCDLDGHALYTRADDNEDAIARRLAAYDAMTGPVLDYYSSEGRLRDVDGAAPPEEVNRSLEEAISGFGA